MRVLVACEESQRVCTAFRERGHEAYSCDIQEPSGGHPEWHILGDVLNVLNPQDNSHCHFHFYGIVFETMDGKSHSIKGKWDLIIAHPPCTYLSYAGNKYFNTERYGVKAVERHEKRIAAAEFFMKFINADCDLICVENPVGYMNRIFRSPDQVIHPYYFSKQIGDEDYHVKRTCLWLKGLQPLCRTSVLEKPKPFRTKPCGRNVYFAENIGGDGKERQKNRSKTFPGIARAMAEQWG